MLCEGKGERELVEVEGAGSSKLNGALDRRSKSKGFGLSPTRCRAEKLAFDEAGKKRQEEVYTGGIGLYALLVMLIAMMQLGRYQQHQLGLTPEYQSRALPFNFLQVPEDPSDYLNIRISHAFAHDILYV
ncbi:unnamed protein product [Camellia sinensis]